MTSGAFTGGDQERKAVYLPAAHADRFYRTTADRGRRVVESVPELPYLSHYRSGVLNFTVDVLDSRPAGPGSGTEPAADLGTGAARGAEPVGGRAAVPGAGQGTGEGTGSATDRLRDRYRHAGRQLISRFEDFGASLLPLDSGELMRMVVSTPHGGVHCGRLRAGEYLLGLAQRGQDVPRMDRAMNDLISEIRTQELRLGAENPGGDQAGDDLPPLAAPSQPHLETGPAFGESSQAKLVDLWSRTVNVADLHYAALYHDWTLVQAGDVFAESELDIWFTGLPRPTRRALYQDIAGRLRADLVRLHHALRRMVPGRVDRLVLDVQAGAVYVHWPWHAPGDFLIGVTLYQDIVDRAERRLRRLAAELPDAAGAPSG
ncbi:hypothetical protein [Sphaerisporangium rufum]|nr:hypothetical protein [Sphaerisporangium rufum]